uniref:GDP-D-glucose phosphorylase 1 n=1 Tax=Panagrellus redivivus TaxID=6233 RepID=A0A7E5A1S4_PANRE
MNSNSPKQHAPMMSRAYRSHSTVQLPVTVTDNEHPVAHFQYKTSDFVYNLRDVSPEREFGDKSFKKQIMTAWEESKKHDVFNYSLNCLYKYLEGDYELSVQLNTERGTLRRKPLRFRSIREPFSHLRFNFTKIRPEEILYKMRCLDKPYSSDPLDVDHLMVVNASPLERGHTLLVPAVNRCQPQILTPLAVRIATDQMLLVEDDNFHVLFNSLLGQASVNHLHMHGVFWPYESDLINRRFDKIAENVFVIERPAWFISAFAFQLPNAAALDTFVDNIAKCADFLTRENIAHNMFFTRAQPIRTSGEVRSEDKTRSLPQLVTAYIFPRQSLAGAKPPTNFNPAALELAGCLTAYTLRFFECITELTALRVIEEEAVLDDVFFAKLKAEVTAKFTGSKTWTACVPELEVPRMEQLSSHELDELADSFQQITSPSPLRHATSLMDEARRKSRETY